MLTVLCAGSVCEAPLLFVPIADGFFFVIDNDPEVTRYVVYNRIFDVAATPLADGKVSV